MKLNCKHSRVSLLPALLITFGAAPAAQAQSPLVVERDGADTVRAGERYEYELTVTNQSDVPLRDVTIKEFTVSDATEKAGQQSSGQRQSGRQSDQQQSNAQNDQQRQHRQPQTERQRQQQLSEERQRSQEQSSQQGSPQNASESYQVIGNEQQSLGSDTRTNQAQQSSRNQGQQSSRQQSGSQQAQSRESMQSPGDMLSERIPFLREGESRTLTVSGIARQEGVLRSCMAIDYQPAVCSEIEVVKPDISLACEMEQPQQQVTMTGDAQQDIATFYACETVNVGCTVTNEGSGRTRQSTLVLGSPDSLRLEQGEAETTVRGIDPGDSEEFNFTLASTEAGRVQLTPMLETEEGTAEARPIEFQVVQPQLEVAVQAPSEEYVSRPVNYTVHIRNTGDVAIPRAQLMLELPEALENISVSSEVQQNGSDEFNFEMLEPGASRMINIQGDAVEPGEAELVARASGYCVEDIERTASVPVQGVPALVLVAYDERDPVTVGENTVYDIKVKNQGTASADNIEITARLGDQFEFVEGSGDSEVQGDGTSVQFAAINELPPGETVSWTVRAKANEAGYARLNLELDSTATRRSITEQEPTRIIN